LTEADNGKTVEVHVGDAVALRLHENASTGYRWAFDDLDTKLVSAQEGTYLRRTDAVGSGGDMQWTVDAKAPGTAPLRLKLWRQWEGDASIQKRFAVTLIIHP
jgi:inhibitor of cysteine peptidase